MSMRDPEARDESAALYVGWEELRRRVAPQLGDERFRALIKLKQQQGFPPYREEWRGFYWPRVRDWLDSENGVGTNDSFAHAEDGPETFDAAPRKKTGLQARPPRPAVLDRETGRSRSDGLSRHLRSVATGRDGD